MTDKQLLKISNLASLNEEDLNYFLSLSEKGKVEIISNLIKYHYAKVEIGSSTYQDLFNAYKGSWVLEKVYRNNQYLREGYTLIYTKTGIIRELTSDIYMDMGKLLVH